MRNPKRQLTTLEEDFRNIGILEEDDSSDEVVEDDLTDDEDITDDLEDFTEEELEQLAALLGLEEGSELTEDDLVELALAIENGEDLEEGFKKIFKGGKLQKVKKMVGKALAKARRYMKSGKGKAAARRAKKKRAKKMKKASFKKRLKKQKMKAIRMGSRKESVESNDVASILEDVQNIVASLTEDENDVQLENAIKAFANVAIISEMLSDFFAEGVELAEDDEELSEELADAAQFFQEQAERSAEVATALDEGNLEEAFDEDFDLDEMFQECMDSLVEGLEFYADLSEEEDEGNE